MRRAGASLASFLRTHRGSASEPESADLAAFLRSRPGGRAELRSADVSGGGVEQGAALFGQLGCRACHEASGIPHLAERTDFAHVTQFLQKPAVQRPDLVAHDFGLDGSQASSLAAWLLSGQMVDASKSPAQPGLLVECFELPFKQPKLPQLDGLEPKVRKLVTVLDESPHSREDNFVLRFSGYLAAPANGDYTFELGADDAGWLFIDDKMVVDNGAIAPFRTKTGTVALTAGAHPIRIVFGQAGGGKQLTVKWSGPGFALRAFAPEELSAKVAALVPVAADPAPEASAVERGRALFAAKRCGACHGGDGLPPRPPEATPWAKLADSVCTATGAKQGIVSAARTAVQWPRDGKSELSFCMQRDGCVACHARDGQGGMTPEARSALAEVEDIGDEGRVPPELSQVGHRLKPAWLLRVLKEGHKARSYVKARMLRLPEAEAQHYAELFQQIDARPGDDVEPEFTKEAVAEGCRIVGTGGSNCVTCHPFGGRRALGPQGMDLTQQFERLRPGWFREWLLHATELRPGTRMPKFWFKDDAADRAQVDAVRTWVSMGASAPVPAGYAAVGSGLVLDPIESPRLHGAFLKGLSARCLAVGTPERVHFAVDLAHGHLAWLWRGAFLDAHGTWDGRAGQLLEPLGTDWVTLSKDCVFTAADGSAQPAQLAGWNVGPDQLPVFRWRVGAATVEDSVRAVLQKGGAVLVRTIAPQGGAVRLKLPTEGGVSALVDGKPLSEVVVQAGARVEVVYQW